MPLYSHGLLLGWNSAGQTVAPTLYASGTQSMSISSTPTILSAPNVAGIFSLHMDLNALAAGDVLEVYLYRLVLSGGTSRLEALLDRCVGAQPADSLIKSYTAPVSDLASTNAIQFGIAQLEGTGRSIPWKVIQY